ncbi:hypothetical protein BO82DRAFT_359734 [Aspergillus uvarum CBS 121591]|uniref:Uncharacterized protein n=1 Tax=Aspergillus uvarum CBS 121591 TaxID=1448315 RepID=A0A319CK58_9EURO|nr:hypothetical protein BO82DRAFT_359734 [Aspergillus uvarum CBS 121591]PYH75798.1 hypothetical protein BO82DRAFT_359734 [Aspergillus uvarum CBS 121591]
MALAERPRILLLSLAYRDFLDEVYSTLFNRLAEVANIKRAKTANAALQIIAETTFKAVIITDEGLTETNQEIREVLIKIKAYVENGGIAIVGLHFPNFTPMDKFRRFFEAFGLAWENGDYHRTTFQLNPSALLPESIETASLPRPYSMKALHVKNAKRQEKIFVPIEGAVTQSLVFPPNYVNQAQAAVAGARLGWGYLIYCGDVNGEDGSNQLILALCGV